MNETVSRLRSMLGSSDESHFVAWQLLQLYEAALDRPGGTFLELGTDRGQGSNALLAACDEVGGRLVSVDIRDCSSAAASPNWTFVQSSSIDRRAIIEAAPFLSDGIDITYVDSLHTPDHVRQEIYTWFDLVREGGLIYFDDVDSGPYMRGRRKDNAHMEISNRRIRELIERVFYANVDKLELALNFGSTGLGLLRKRVPFGARLSPPGSRLKPRRNELLAKIARRVSPRYRHKGDGSDFITEPTKS